MKASLSIVTLILLISALSIAGSPIENSFSTALKSMSERDAKSGDAAEKDPNSSPINSAMLREFISEFLRALRRTLDSPSSGGDEATNKLERRHDAGTSRFRFPDYEQVKLVPSYLEEGRSQSLSLQSRPSPQSQEGGLRHMARIEKVAKPAYSTVSLSTGLRTAEGGDVVRKARADPNVPPPLKVGKPSTIMSQPLRIVDGPRDGKRGRSLKEIDVQGVKIIVGERVPDSPEDKFFTWRNARVIKGTLVPNENGRTVKSRGTNVKASQ